MKLRNIYNYKVDKNEKDSFKITLELKKKISDFIEQELFLDLLNEFSSILKTPLNVCLKKSKQILFTSFDFMSGKFNNNLKRSKVFKDAFIFLSIIFWGSIFSKNIKNEKKIDIILDDVEQMQSIGRFGKLLSYSIHQ